MAQTLVNSPEIIYDTLTGDTTFMGYVGTYTFTTGVTQDSISIITPGATLPQLQSTSGMEVVIHDVGMVSRMDYLTDPSDSVATWKVYLIAWPGSNGATINNAINRMIRLFGGCRTVDISSAAVTIGALTQSLVMIPSSSPVL